MRRKNELITDYWDNYGIDIWKSKIYKCWQVNRPYWITEPEWYIINEEMHGAKPFKKLSQAEEFVKEINRLRKRRT